MSQEISFNLQHVVESDMVCADGVCFVPASAEAIVREDTPAEPQRD